MSEKEISSYASRLFGKLDLPSIPVVYADRSGFYMREIPLISKERICVQEGVGYKGMLEILKHETGHYFYEYYSKNFCNVIDQRKVKSLFGNMGEVSYFLNQSLISGVSSITGQDIELPLEKGYVSSYAQVHPHEDWAETFVVALNSVLSNKAIKYKDRVINEKIAFIKECIFKVYSR